MQHVHQVSATTLYNYVQCPTRVALDYFGDPKERDPANAFVEMLWERGTLYEKQVIRNGGFEFLDLSGAVGEEKERLTLKAMKAQQPLIYNGRIVAGDLVGVPDLLRRHESGYLPIDIKSGRGKDDAGEDQDAKPKVHYGVQLALYVDILEQLGLSAGRRGFIFDIHGREVEYDLEEPRGVKNPKTLWETYQEILHATGEIAAGLTSPKGALASACKLCHWHTCCSHSLRQANDLTLIAGLGRARRDALEVEIPDVETLAAIQAEAYVTKGKTPFKGIAEKSLVTFVARAKLLTTPGAEPCLKEPIALPQSRLELFFDIEVDPLRDLTYLHGIVERTGGENASERFVSFFTDDESEISERDAFAQAVEYLAREPDATIWFYSPYERTTYRKLQGRYPDVCPPETIEKLFAPARAIDLYTDVVARATEWPTNDQSLKTLARYLGFNWRDTNPSGAASIEWFDRWVKTRDDAIRARILEYNEDDCRATRVLLDGIRALAN